MNVLLGVCGGIAAYKAAYLANGLKKRGHSLDVVMTDAACKFITPLTIETLCGRRVHTDLFSMESPESVAHIALAKRADIAVIAPATANTISKLACGLADNLLTASLLACTCPVLVVPAMNTAMFLNPATQNNMRLLRERGFIVMEPDTGLLACGDSGIGKMPEPEEIIERIDSISSDCFPLKGKKALVTAGPTREPLDPVRYISNRSSGKMGYAMASEALKMGAEVVLVTGPTCIHPPLGAHVINVITAAEMQSAVEKNKQGCDIIIMCAAVSDYTPSEYYEHKIKKGENIEISLVKTPDILKGLGENKSCLLVGFAAETDNIDEYAQKKLVEKNIDIIAANDVSSKETGFESNYNAVTLFKRGGEKKELAKAPKAEIARLILLEAADMLNAGNNGSCGAAG